MKVSELIPQPLKREPFNRKFSKFVPKAAGCYVLSSADDVILYVGLAANLRRRNQQHLDSSDKVSETELGRSFYFSWIETADLARIERTWMNTHLAKEGVLPILNRMYSPTAT